MAEYTFRLTIEYDGTEFAGWQTQTGGRTIQQELEKALSSLFDESIKVTAAGRTDAGVHAEGQVVHFRTAVRRSSVAIVKGGNRLLPDDIRIVKAVRAAATFHARYGARYKTYRYTFLGRPSALRRAFGWYAGYDLDHRAMGAAAGLLEGTHDFRSFCVVKSEKPHYRCTIMRATVKKAGKDIRLEITGDRFLHNMVRIIAGTLFDVGRGKISPVAMKKIIRAKDRKAASQTAPARGLVLKRVVYMDGKKR